MKREFYVRTDKTQSTVIASCENEAARKFAKKQKIEDVTCLEDLEYHFDQEHGYVEIIDAADGYRGFNV